MDCVFCNIAKGYSPASVRHESEGLIAFDDLYPKASTHVLIIPREHHEHLDSWIDAGGSGDEMLQFVTATAVAAGVAGNYRVLTNIGREAGQVIPHLHWHLMSGDLAAF